MGCMFKIGDFSRFSRVSVKMLRHYDELGLLKPAWVDPESSYRYYAADQLPRLNRIVMLKDLGFRLEQIGVMLDEALSVEQIRGMLRLRRAELERVLRETAVQLTHVESQLKQLDQSVTVPPYDVVLRGVGPQMMAAIRQTVHPESNGIPALFEELETYVAQYKARAPLPPVLLYHDEDIEVMVPVQKPVPINGRFAIHQLPGHDTMACLIHTGRYDGLPHAFTLLLGWIEQHSYTIVGPTRELYLRFGADQQAYTLPNAYLTQNATEFVTELQIPVITTGD